MADVLKEVKLRFLEGENEGIEIRLEVPREVVIGRGEDCDIYLGEKKISRRHARLSTSRNGLVLEDMRSTNGTFVNGKRVTAKETLANEDSVRIGTSVFQIEFIAEEAGARASKSAPKAKEPARAAPPPTADAISVSEPQPRDLNSDLNSFGNISLSGSAQPSGSRPAPAKPAPPTNPTDNDDDDDAIEIDIDFAPEPLPVAPPARAAKGGGLAGNLSAMPLPDLLQTFANARRTGILKLTGKVKGQVYLEEGKIIYAVLEQAILGEKALFRMLGWKDAAFELVPLPEKFAPSKALGPRLDSSTENLLIEAFRQFDELEKLRKSLPEPETRLSINSKMQNPLSKLHPRVLDVMQLILHQQSFESIMDQSTASDLDTAKMIFYLLKKDYIRTD